MNAYYNEIDRHAAAWLRELIRCGHIAPGEVDERSIVDVRPDDLRGFTQCHFFAGIGVWSYALRRAGWADSRPAWTGSCPCQPFSAAGKGDEYGDDRHLWPAWFRIIRECRPVALFGEQVASKVALAWLDHVCVDLEAADYAVGAVDTCAAGFGAPHIRQRLYFVADQEESWRARGQPAGHGEPCELADTNSRRWGERRGKGLPIDGDTPYRHNVDGCGEDDARRCGKCCFGCSVGEIRRCYRAWSGSLAGPERRRAARRLGDADSTRSSKQRGRSEQSTGFAAPGSVNGFWSDAQWIACRDGKSRPTQPGVAPLVAGAPARVVRLRGYGNAICAPQAEEFIRAYLNCRAEAKEA